MLLYGIVMKFQGAIVSSVCLQHGAAMKTWVTKGRLINISLGVNSKGSVLMLTHWAICFMGTIYMTAAVPESMGWSLKGGELYRDFSFSWECKHQQSLIGNFNVIFFSSTHKKSSSIIMQYNSYTSVLHCWCNWLLIWIILLNNDLCFLLFIR